MPELFTRDGATWARHGSWERRLERSHQDRRKPAFWRAVDASGKPLTEWLMNPKIAAIRALGK